VDPATLFEENHEALCRYLIRYTGDADLAADLVQESFVRLLEHRPAAGAARQWLFRVATNLACDAARGRRRRHLILQRAGGRLPVGDPPPTPDERVEMAERAARMQQALLTLSEKERTALLLREEGFRHHEIAATIGAAPGSVGTLLARAIRKLAPALDLQREDL
jgi:RNA polymerase sigma-70 factor, ECF subfamily